MAKMTKDEREAFLAGVHIGVVSVTTGAGNTLAVPIWYGYETGGDVWVLTEPTSVKGRSFEAAGRFSLCAQTEDPPYKYVTVEGPVAESEVADEASRQEMAHRYLGQEFGDAYLEATADQDASRIYRMTPEHWYTVDYAKDLGA
jgi:PPOX class probable F420-dependent enzyme